MFENIETPSMKAVNNAMNSAFYRQNLLLNNIANMDTPGYTFTDMNFKDYLNGLSRKKQNEQMKLMRTDGNHISETKSNPIEQYPLNNYKDASIEKEMTKMVETTLFFDAMVQVHNNQMTSIKSAITGGR